MNPEWMGDDDELSAADLAFMEALETLGKDEHADDAYAEAEAPHGDFDAEGEAEGESENYVGESENGNGEPQGEASEDGEENPEQGEADSMSLGELDGSGDTSGTESSDEADERDHLEGGDTDSDIPEGEDDLEQDDPLDEDSLANWQGLGAEDDELQYDDDGDEDMEFDADDHGHGQVEDEFEGDERGNTDSEIEDLEEYEREREEHQLDELKAEEEREHEDGYPDNEPEHDSEADDAELDVIHPELEENDLDEKSPREEVTEEDRKEPEVGDIESSQDKSKDQDQQNQQHEPEDSGESEQERPEGIFEGIPESPELCDNHCEDNDLEDHDGECPHCTARLKRERELWGEIAQDKNGRPILPGDKMRVVVPISFMVPGTILTANVPNLEVDPIRVAESTSGAQDHEICWLSGHSISQFTGWHLIDNGPIWTFKKGKKIRFVEKISEPEFQGHGSNDLDGSQLDAEDLIEKFKEQLDEELGETEEQKAEFDSDIEEENDEETEAEEDGEEEGSSENEVEDSEAEGSEGDGDHQRDSDDSDGGDDADSSTESELEEQRNEKLSGVQKKRFENLTARITKKIIDTFGNTLEGIEVSDVTDRGSFATAYVKIMSRGTTFTMHFQIRRYDDDLDRDAMVDEEDAA